MCMSMRPRYSGILAFREEVCMEHLLEALYPQ
jgi:hypothetical protein